MPVSTIGPARRAKNGGVRKVGVIANAGGSKRPRGSPALRERLQLTRFRSARASAQHSHLRILCGGLAADRVVMNLFRCGRVRRASISVRARAVRRSDACSSAKPTGGDGNAVGACAGCDGRVQRPTPRKLVSPYCEAVCRRRILPRLGGSRRGRAGSVTAGLPLPFSACTLGASVMSDWQASEARPLAVEVLGERYRRYRLADPAAEEAMARSLQRYGQIAPVVVCVHNGSMEVVDGFKRLGAARLLLPRWTTLSVRVLAVDERGAKAAIYGLNRVSHSTHELEEAWIVHALVREDGLSQVEAASLLGRHKSWVCRRLALLERLSPEAKEDLRLGLLSVSVARQLVRLPAGNQAEVLHMTHREALNATEVRGAVDLLLTSVSREQEEYVLSKPREALQQAHVGTPRAHDPRLSVAANPVRRLLVGLLHALHPLQSSLLPPAPPNLPPPAQ